MRTYETRVWIYIYFTKIDIQGRLLRPSLKGNISPMLERLPRSSKLSCAMRNWSLAYCHLNNFKTTIAGASPGLSECSEVICRMTLHVFEIQRQHHHNHQISVVILPQPCCDGLLRSSIIDLASALKMIHYRGLTPLYRERTRLQFLPHRKLTEWVVKITGVERRLVCCHQLGYDEDLLGILL